MFQDDGSSTFRWPVYVYRWVSVALFDNAPDKAGTRSRSRTSTPAWILVPDMTGRHPPRLVDSLRIHPALFRTFADLDGRDREAILAFANQHGLLEDAKVMATHRAWQAQIFCMRHVLELWDRLQKGQARELAHFLRWQDERSEIGQVHLKGGWVYQGPREQPGRGPEALLPQEFLIPPLGHLHKDDIYLPTRLLIQALINERLHRRVAARLVYNQDTTISEIQLVPSDLLGALWLQFAEALASNHEYKKCKQCGAWFAIASGEDGRTARREFCSDPCKSKDYRERRKPGNSANRPRKKR
jgi:hypothetical protein